MISKRKLQENDTEKSNKSIKLKIKKQKIKSNYSDQVSSQNIQYELNSDHDNNEIYDDSNLNDEIKIDYNIPKPGPHAKADEWRKWKTMKRTIKQKREERYILKKQIKQKDQIELKKSSDINQNNKQKNFSLSIAIPSSIISKILLKELKTYFAGQIGRAATLFFVDEIIVYNEFSQENKILSDNTEQFIKILEYLECPQYLRKSLFPPNKHLEHVGLVAPLEAPHHFRINDEWIYREGVSTDIPSKENKGSWVDIGLKNKIQIDRKLEPGIRVTVKKMSTSSEKALKAIVVSPETPRLESNLYWGYQVRYAQSFGKILNESSFKENYDFKIGVNLTNKIDVDIIDQIKKMPKRILVVFGGISGLEAAIEADEKLKANKPQQIFDVLCQSEQQHFGSRSIRLEEAILITLSLLNSKLFEMFKKQNNDKPFQQ